MPSDLEMADKTDVASLLRGYSIEVTARGAASAEICRAHLAAGTEVYIAFTPRDTHHAVVDTANPGVRADERLEERSERHQEHLRTFAETEPQNGERHPGEGGYVASQFERHEQHPPRDGRPSGDDPHHRPYTGADHEADRNTREGHEEIAAKVVGVPTIAIWTRYYRRKFAPAARRVQTMPAI